MLRELHQVGSLEKMSDPRSFEHAIAVHSTGDHKAAADLYKSILAESPEHHAAIHFLGVAEHQSRRNVEAIRLMLQSIGYNALIPAYHSNLGSVYRSIGNHQDALKSYLVALSLLPANADSHFNVGCSYQDLKNWSGAMKHYDAAIAIDPRHRNARCNRGVTLRQMGLLDESIAALDSLRKDYSDDAEILNNLGVSLLNSKRIIEAIKCFDHCEKLSPSYLPAVRNRAKALSLLGKHHEAIREYSQLIESNRSDATSYAGKGAVLHQQGRFCEAITCFRRAIEIEPNHADAHLNLSMSLLLTGQMTEGWREYEWRFKTSRHGISEKCYPRWAGESLHGRTIMLFAEQGIGDSIQFIRYARLLKEFGATVLVHCQAQYVPLLRCASGVDEVFSRSEPLPPFDYAVPMMSLPLMIGTTLESIPAERGYFHPDKARAEYWRSELSSDDHKPLIGICWQGNTNHPLDHTRSFSLRCFRPLTAIGGSRFVSLQKGAATKQIGETPEVAVEDLSSQIDQQGAFLDTIAIVAQLDLVVTSDTSIAHLAAAVGTPVWIALPYIPDFRWLMDRSDSPWYPTARLFRKRSEQETWEDLFSRITIAFGAFVQNRQSASPSLLSRV